MKRRLVFWFCAALATSALLAGVLYWEHGRRVKFATFLAGNPHRGAHLFETKGCARCHAVGGRGGGLGPDLGYELRGQPTLNHLVASMWNHAPAMWQRMSAEKVAYPALDEEDISHIFAFLYTARYVDEPGDPRHGRRLFESKGCARCHAVKGEGGRIGPDLAGANGIDTPIVWAEAMWNHAPTMEANMQKLRLAWPRFEGREMNDLLAYIREISGGERREAELLPADPDRGLKVFREKSCIACHAIKGEGQRIGPDLGPPKRLPPTLVQFAGSMWNHSPEMWQAMRARKVARPTFQEHQMADLMAFLYSLRYFEPGGTPQVGRNIFQTWGCARCHGGDASGTPQGPALRGRNRTFHSIRLAEALWRCGPKMYERTRQMSVAWPAVAGDEIGDLLAFLNTPPEASK